MDNRQLPELPTVVSPVRSVIPPAETPALPELGVATGTRVVHNGLSDFVRLQ